MKIIIDSLISFLSSFKRLVLFVGFFLLFIIFWYIINDTLMLTYAFAMGQSDPSLGTFTITSLQPVSCNTISEFSSSMNSLITEPTPAPSGNGHQRFIKVTASVVNTEGMSMLQKMTIQAMPNKCFIAYGELTK